MVHIKEYNMRKLVLILLIGSFIVLASGAQSDSLTRSRLEASVKFLADDLLEGRATPSRGLDLAALYLANQLRSAGLQPGNGDSYYQSFATSSYSPEDAKYTVTINGIRLDSSEYLLFPNGLEPSGVPHRFNIVFAGYGIYAPDRNVNDYEGVDVRDKAVVTMLGAPWDPDPAAIHAYDRISGKERQAMVRKASCFIYVSKDFETFKDSSPVMEVGIFRDAVLMPTSYLSEYPKAGGPPGLILLPSAFNRALAKAASGTYEEWAQRLKRGNSAPSAIEGQLEITTNATPHEGKASNVVAIIPGTDSVLKKEWVVLSAHYDHLGALKVPEGQDGIYNGADDNASGTATVLEIGRRLVSEHRPKRSVLVICYAGEEVGLLGSAYHALRPLVPLDQVVLNINIDMVGRSDSTLQSLTPGCEELLLKAQEIGRRSGFAVLPDNYPTWRLIYFVDSYHFARFGIPIIECFTGMHSDYHQTTDEVGRIRFDKLENIFNVLYEFTDFYAQGGKRPVFQRPDWFITPD
jgi:hypothetical protein